MMTGYLRQLGVYGYDPVEPVIIAALVSGDPLLLVGKAGTGKTFLLNSLSEALRLELRLQRKPHRLRRSGRVSLARGTWQRHPLHRNPGYRVEGRVGPD